MFTSCLAEITAINGRKLSVKPLGIMGGVTPPQIHDVPLGLLGNKDNHTDHKLEIGNIIIVLFTTFDISNYMAFGSKDTAMSISLNDYNNAIALPIVFGLEELKVMLPESISHIGNVNHVGDTTQKGNVTQTGEQTTTGIIHSDTDVTGTSISLVNHTHKYNPGPGVPTPTQKPE